MPFGRPGGHDMTTPQLTAFATPQGGGSVPFGRPGGH